ncbi:MAG: NADH-quinone oxidoreductase subunit NuoN [Anaerolineales bacterium]|nr:NADH-quinone oxidoreductase subunit NuoN [Anaerolineales bacterium]
MSFAQFVPSHLLAILPEILLLVLAGVLLAIDIFWRKRRRNWLGWVSVAGLIAILILSVLFSRPEVGFDQPLLFGGVIRHDWPAFSFKIVFLFAAAVTSLLSLNVQSVSGRGEYFALLIVSTLGMNLMASAADLIMLFLAIESTSIPLYILAGFIKSDEKSTESGLKYFLFGALTSAVMLYGFSLLYGYSGDTNIYRMASAIQPGGLSPWVLIGVALLVLVGFAFKIAAVPFHFWSPDVYEGAPTPITAFISTGSKAAGFAVLVRVMLAAFPSIESYWSLILAIMAAVTMTLGNLLAIPQQNIKRLLAYSSIAHAGYAMIGLVALSIFGAASLVFYLIGYVVANLAAFSVVILFARSAGSEEIADYAGLSRRSPWLALALLVALLSLAGMPPLVGFVGKFYVFASAVQSGWIWLAFVGVLNAMVGLYYYLTILKVVYLYRSEEEDKAIAVPFPYALALVFCIVAIVVIGTVSGPWLNVAIEAAKALF